MPASNFAPVKTTFWKGAITCVIIVALSAILFFAVKLPGNPAPELYLQDVSLWIYWVSVGVGMALSLHFSAYAGIGAVLIINVISLFVAASRGAEVGFAGLYLLIIVFPAAAAVTALTVLLRPVAKLENLFLRYLIFVAAFALVAVLNFFLLSMI